MNAKLQKPQFLNPGLLLGALLLLPASGIFAATDEENFNKSLDYTRKVIEKHHLISLVDIDLNFSKDTKKENKLSFRYDHYPESQRIQLKDGTTYAREKGKKWLKSDDWGKTGKKVSDDKAEELEAMISFADAPLGQPVSKDASQGGNVVELIKREPHDTLEYVFYEMRREKSTGFAYPKFVFLKFPKDSEDRLLLKGYAGTMYSGKEKVWVNINYEYMFLMNIVEEKPAASKTAAAKTVDHPAPEAGDKVYNFTELDQSKMDLKGKVVRVQLTGWGVKGEDLGDGVFRYMVKDTAKPTASYGQVDFPNDGAKKIGLGDKPAKKGREPVIYVLVMPRNEKVVAQFTALGTKFKKDDEGKGGYSW